VYLQQNGFAVIEIKTNELQAVKEQYHVPEVLRACHTAIVRGYIIEGHVPVTEIYRLLAARPKILGIGVAGMPPGSPGMGNLGAHPATIRCGRI